MSKLQSKNITMLCLELGIGEGFPNSDAKVFTKSITDFRIAFEAQGNHLPASSGRVDTTESQHFALAFCLEQDRAERLWPSNAGPLATDQTHKGRPSWPRDRDLILSRLAHIFSLQAFYKYQRDLKDRKKETPRSANMAPEQHSERELSPESMKYARPSPPSGTRRRPAKPDNSLEAQSAAANTAMIQACIAEVEGLDPRNDDRPVIKEFTPQWLGRSASRWPAPADVRMKTLMHINDWYPLDPEVDSTKLLKMTVPLKKGTEIESCTIDQYKEFEKRVRERMLLHSQELWANKFVEQGDEEKPQKHPVFRDVWKNRYSYWAPKGRTEKATPKPAPAPALNHTYRDDIFDFLDDDDLLESPSRKVRKATMPPPPKPNAPKPALNSPQPKTEISAFFAKSPTRGVTEKRQMTDDFLYEDDSHPRRKKQRTETAEKEAPATPNQMRAPSPASNAENFPGLLDAVEEETHDQEMEDSIRTAHEVLSSNIGEEAQALPLRSQHEARTLEQQARLLTPTSPGDLLAIPGSVSSTLKPDAVAVQRSSISPHPDVKAQPMESPPSRAAPWSPESSFNRSTAPSPAPNRQRLVLVTQGADGRFDMRGESTLSALHFRNSSVFEFFDLYSAKSKASFESLTCLTFTFLFAQGEDMVVHRGDVAQWKRLKDLARLLFKLHSNRKPNTTEFEVTVEIGDKTIRADDGEADDDVWGF